MTQPTSHDQNFKNLILDYPRQALELFATQEATDLLPDVHITPIRQEQLKERLGDRFFELDIPLLVEWPDQRREALLFVIEQETYPRRYSLYRMAHYVLHLSELCNTERVVPVVIILHGQQPLPDQLQLGSERHTYLQFNILKTQLTRLPACEYLDSNNLVARLNLPNMNHRNTDKVETYAKAMEGLVTLEPDIEKQLKYIDFVDIYSNLNPQERLDYKRRYPQEERAMAGLSERLRSEGMQQGMQQGMQRGMQRGMQQGMQQGETRILKKLIQLKFGALPDWAEEIITTASTEQLEHWAEGILTAASIDELLGKKLP